MNRLHCTMQPVYNASWISFQSLKGCETSKLVHHLIRFQIKIPRFFGQNLEILAIV